MPALRKPDRRHRRLLLVRRLLLLHHRHLQHWPLAEAHPAVCQSLEGAVAGAGAAGLQGLELPLALPEPEHHQPVWAWEEAAGHQHLRHRVFWAASNWWRTRERVIRRIGRIQ